MPRYRGKSKGKHHNWNKHHFSDDHDDNGSGDHRSVSLGLHCRDQGRNRKSYPPGGNTERLKRVMAMNLLPTPSGNVPSSQNTGLGLGEAWARITIIQGAEHPLAALQELVNAALGTQLRFYNVCIEGRNAVMYTKIRQKQLTQFRKSLLNLRNPTTGKELVNEISLVSEPRVPSSPSNPAPTAQNLGSFLPESWMEALRSCFRERFQPVTRSLDLSSLHTEPSLLSQGLYLPLNRQAVVHALVSILRDNSAQLSLLNLSSNRLTHLNSFSPLAATSEDSQAVSIERIDLSANPLNGVAALVGLRGIANLIELDVTETPLAARFKQSDRALATQLRKLIPGLKRLNGEDLPETVQFAIERGSNNRRTNAQQVPLPESHLGYFPSDEVKMPLLTFLKDYFSRYDSQPRGDNLLPFYSAASQLVMSVVPEMRTVGSGSNPYSSLPPTTRIESVADDGTLIKTYLTTSRLSHTHFSHSRNLLRCRDEYRRRDLVIRGAVAIAALLNELPATEHPLESFTVDVTFRSDTQILFTVAGVFYEVQPIVSSNNSSTGTPTQKTIRKILRCFSRTMIVVAPGGHIIQDDFIISNPSPALCKRYISEAANKVHTTGSTSNTPSHPAQPPTEIQGTSNVLVDPNTQMNLVNQLQQQSGMNALFARQCLEEYAWNLDVAFNAFQTLNAAGKIPPNAFDQHWTA